MVIIPPNSRSLIQWIDQKVISKIKTHYLKKITEMMVTIADDKNMTVNNFAEVSPS